MTRARIASLCTVAWLAAPFASGAAVDVDLSVDASTDVVVTLLSMAQDGASAPIAGSVSARVELVDDETYGLVASSVRILGGSLVVGDVGLAVDGGYESLDVAFGDGVVSAGSPPIAATPVGANTAEIPLADLLLGIDGGTLTAAGTVVDFEILVARDFAEAPWPLSPSGVATIVTTPNASGNADVVLTIPIAEATPLRPPFLVTWVSLDGVLSLSGESQPVELPASPHPLAIAACLSAAGWLVARRRRRR